MSVYRTNNPTEYDDIDGIVIDESAPPSSIQGASTNVALLIGAFQRGPESVVTIGSLQQLRETFGDDNSFGGAKALKNKRFGQLKVRRVVAAGALVASLTLTDGGGTPVNIATVEALYKGAYGNLVNVTVEAGTTSGTKKITLTDLSVGTVLPSEVYDNLLFTGYASAAAMNQAGIFAGSKIAKVTVLATSANPANLAATALTGGTDSSVIGTDYEAAIESCETTACNVVFLDEYTGDRRTALELHAANTQDRMVVLAGAEGDTPAQTITAVSDHRDSQGRIIYAYSWVQTTIDGVSQFVSPASWVASILSQSAPNVDPAFAANTQFTLGITGLKTTLTRADYIALKDSGVAAFEFDSDLGYKLKSGVVTQIADSTKTQILRRRMADFLTSSAARFLKAYQNAPNTKSNREAVAGAILNFVLANERDGLLPRDSEVETKRAKLIDTSSLNTDTSIGQGYFYVLWKQRIYSSMRYIIVKAQIGETVTVSASE